MTDKDPVPRWQLILALIACTLAMAFGFWVAYIYRSPLAR